MTPADWVRVWWGVGGVSDVVKCVPHTARNLLRTQMEEELNDFAAAHGISVTVSTDGHAVLDRSSDALAAPE